MLMAATLAVLFAAHGTRAVSMKFAQQGRVSTIRQALVFTTLFSAFQLVLLLVTPPYHFGVPDTRFLIYPLGFAVFYTLGYILLLRALSEGSASITNTVASFNTLVVIAFSVLVWHEAVSIPKVVGLALFIAGIILYNKSSYSVGGKPMKMSPKWLLYVISATLFNGISVIFTKLSMRDYPQMGKEYLIYYCAIAAVIGLVLILCFARREVRPLVHDKGFLLHTCVAALAFDVSNYIFVSLINQFPTVLFMPLVSIVNMSAILVFSRIILKERISKYAVISSGICLVAIVLLNF